MRAKFSSFGSRKQRERCENDTRSIGLVPTRGSSNSLPVVDGIMTEEDIEIYEDENGLRIHFETDDNARIVSSLAERWSRICERAIEEIARLDASAPQRLVVIARPDCGALFFSLESSGKFISEIASVTIESVEEAFMSTEDDSTPFYEQLRQIARQSFEHSSAGKVLAGSDLSVAIDNYQSVDSTTLEVLFG